MAVACGDDENQKSNVVLASADQFDSMDYYGVLNGDLSLPGASARTISEDEWRDLVTTQRSDGLESMTQDDRSILLQGAVKAYLRVVSGTRRVVEVNRKHSAERVERYAIDDGLFVSLRESEQISEGILVGWGDNVYFVPGRHHVSTSILTSGDGVTISAWTFDESGSSTCSVETDAAGFGFSAHTYYTNLTAIFMEGSATREFLNDREVEVLARPYTAADEQRIWLDRLSLFPLRFETPELRDERGEQFQPAKLISITEFNPPPDAVSVPDDVCN